MTNIEALLLPFHLTDCHMQNHSPQIIRKPNKYKIIAMVAATIPKSQTVCHDFLSIISMIDNQATSAVKPCQIIIRRYVLTYRPVLKSNKISLKKIKLNISIYI